MVSGAKLALAAMLALVIMIWSITVASCTTDAAKTMRAIPINASTGPKALLRSMQAAKEALQAGDVVCIFAEGGISRIGQLLPFQRGLLRIIEGTTAPVIPVYLDELWGSIFSFSEGKFFWKWPRRWPYPVTIVFGKPLHQPESVHEVRQAVQNLGVVAVEKRKRRLRTVARQFLRTCRRQMFRKKIADSQGQSLTGRQLLLRTLALRRVLAREVIGPDEKMVGILLPPSVGGVLANTATTLMCRTAVNLNYTIAAKDLQGHLDICRIKHVLTSRKFLEKLPLQLDTEFVILEDLKDKVTPVDKLVAALQTYLVPVFLL